MSQHKDLSSTEQLLDVIRGTKEILGKKTAKQHRSVSRSKVSVASGTFDPRKTTVGISYDSSGIWLVAVEGGGKNHVVADYAHIDMEIPDDADPRDIADRIVKEGHDRRFALKKTQVWLLLRSDSIDQWTVTVPKKVEGKEESKAVFWAAKAKKKFDETVSIFDYYRIDECTEKGIDKLRMGAFTIPRAQVYTARERFAAAGISLAGVSAFSLCCSQLLENPPKGMDDPPVAVIRVDQEWSRIDLFHQHALAFTRRIKTGVESFAVSIQERYRSDKAVSVESGDIELELDIEDGSLGPEEVSMEEALAILNGQGTRDDQGDTSPPSLTDSEFMELIEPAVQRLVRQLERTFDHFRSSMKVPALKKILFVGQLARFETIVRYIGTQLDIEAGILDPFATTSITTSLPVPSSIAVRTSSAAAVAAALSRRHLTPNFLYTYQSKRLDNQLKKVPTILLASFLGCALGVAGYFMYNQQVLDAKKSELQTLTKELSSYTGDVSGERTRQLLDKLKKQNVFLKEYTDRFAPLAVFAEIARITPPSIVINSLIYNNKEGGETSNIILDGFVAGKEIMLDSYLSNYMVMLDDSPLFTQPAIQKRTRAKSGEEEQIRFVLNVKIM